MKALIVDDEARVRKAVRLLVDWEAHGIREIAEADGGNEAIEMIQRSAPSLVIMDMMMTSGHGLDLMAWVREHAGNIKFIVVSGHDDFDFVRSTVRHGGIDYILKPIEPEAINAAVAKAVEQIRREEQERLDQQHRSIRLNEIKPIYGEKLLSSLIDEPGAAESSLRRLRQEGVIPGEVAAIRLMLAQVDPGDASLLQRFAGNSDLLHFALINVCNEFLLPDHSGVAFKHWGAQTEIVLLLWAEPERAPELIAQINDGLYATLQRRLHFGLAAAGELPQSLPRQYAEALAALRRRNLLEPDKHIHTLLAGSAAAAPGTGGSLSLTFAKVQEDWKLAVRSADPAQIAAASRKWIDELSRLGTVTPEMLAAWTSDILSFRSGLIRETLGDKTDSVLTELERDDAGHAPPSADSYTFSHYAWSDWAEQVMTGLADVISRQQARDKSTFADIVKYIEQNYQSDLSLQDIASHFYVSREYVSRKFKQDYGINFSDYLGKYRIDKAKLLMLNPHLKLQDIAEMVGFHDVKYFSKVFKKQVGQSPREYRGK
ncbi:response regulator [Paenibacillus macerans]|uniref:Response regulator n=1 Tax=Paenibacillus macerans TaxID=44252 RepID=A0A6N8F375_PAEMA|nr:helix-turn-helix domain-containing protein [Paenibacillus macerans]MBS5913527.1 response regulator [Paenibacillus macerans]MDU5947129.1 response regulator [Paenibacillus macerans]MEC0139046.1 response regulator [Paenibacillus macerans]MUG26389.1 response regulator [Paenibacillus macerans]UMV50103.1 response regulator [Paenibacillus macerans]